MAGMDDDWIAGDGAGGVWEGSEANGDSEHQHTDKREAFSCNDRHARLACANTHTHTHTCSTSLPCWFNGHAPPISIADAGGRISGVSVFASHANPNGGGGVVCACDTSDGFSA